MRHNKDTNSLPYGPFTEKARWDSLSHLSDADLLSEIQSEEDHIMSSLQLRDLRDQDGHMYSEAAQTILIQCLSLLAVLYGHTMDLNLEKVHFIWKKLSTRHIVDDNALGTHIKIGESKDHLTYIRIHKKQLSAALLFIDAYLRTIEEDGEGDDNAYYEAAAIDIAHCLITCAHELYHEWQLTHDPEGYDQTQVANGTDFETYKGDQGETSARGTSLIGLYRLRSLLEKRNILPERVQQLLITAVDCIRQYGLRNNTLLRD